jgi:4-hydroxymandelate oxidase
MNGRTPCPTASSPWTTTRPTPAPSLDANAWAYFSRRRRRRTSPCAPTAAPGSRCACCRACCARWRAATPGSRCWGARWPTRSCWRPVAWQRMAHPDGESPAPWPPARSRPGLVLSTQASTPLEAWPAPWATPDRGPLWFQLYLQHDRGFTRRTGATGRSAPATRPWCSPWTRPARRPRPRAPAGFRLPPGIRAVNLDGLPPAPTQALPGQSALFDGLLQPGAHLGRRGLAAGRTRLPVLLKGVLHPDDARQAAALQVAGLIVSNHGGRTLDTAVSTAEALPRIAEALRRRACRCWWMAASAAAPTCSRPWPWAPAPC